jgi:hypothetical protein
VRRPRGPGIPARRLLWQAACRIIPSRFPPISLFDQVAAPEDLEKIVALEAKTNDRIRDEVGDFSRVPAHERISGPNTSVIMASFTHLNPEGSRFSDGTYGVFYAARALQTAIAETMFHRARFMRATNQDPIELDMRVYHVRVAGNMHDLRGLQEDFRAEYSRTSYAASQALATQLRAQDSMGITWDSVRHAGGQCVAVFRPRALSHCVEVMQLCYVWDGNAFSGYYQKGTFSALPGLD